MKKLVKILILVMVLFVPLTFASAKKTTTTTTEAIPKDGTPVKLYVFYGSGCTHCADLHTYISELQTDKEYNFMFELVDYEVWSDKTNATLMNETAKLLNTQASGVPFYVVGSYYASGFPNPEANAEKFTEVTDELKAQIKKNYIELNKADSTYVDLVATIGEGHAANSGTVSKDNDVVGYVLLGITIIIIVAIVFGRSSTKEDFESDIQAALKEEEVKEEVVEEPKKTTTKKSSTKKSTSKKTTAKKSPAKKTATKKSTAKKNK